MSRLSRDNKREAKRAARSAPRSSTVVPAPGGIPVDVRVPLPGGPGASGGPGTTGGPGTPGGNASVDGARIVAAPGEEIQHAVLNHLQRLALTAGSPVLATVHDERIGYVVPLQVHGDGSSRLAGEPVPMPRQPSERPEALRPPLPAPPLPQPYEPVTPHRDKATHVLRAATPNADTNTGETPPTFPLRAVPEPQPQPEAHPQPEAQPQPKPKPKPSPEPEPLAAPSSDVPSDDTPVDHAAEKDTAPVEGAAAAAPLGAFGPPPVMPPRDTAPGPTPAPAPAPAPVSPVSPVLSGIEPEPDPKPTPARGFDAVAEAVLSDDPATLAGEGGAPALLAEPMARINEAVKEGRIETAAELSEQTVTHAARTLGHDHPEVLRLRELTAYIAYLAGDPVRSLRLSLDLVGLRRQADDAEAAYGNVQSAASAWRAVRDPELGLRLGRDLIALWTELADEGGPAAEDIEELESARARMGRLAERARRASGPAPDRRRTGPAPD